MTRSSSQRAARFFALAMMTSATALLAGAAHAQRVPSQQNPLDRSDLGRSKQDPNLKGIPIPPTVTAVEKLPVDKIKLPRGFSATRSSAPGRRSDTTYLSFLDS
jgi:hypothetical protein